MPQGFLLFALSSGYTHPAGCHRRRSFRPTPHAGFPGATAPCWVSASGTPAVGGILQQTVGTGQTAFGYISSYDSDVNVIKYIQDRSLYFGNKNDQTDYANVTNGSQQFDFVSTTSQIAFPGGSGSVETTFSSGITTDVKNNNVALGVSFTSGLASPEINKGSGDLLYIDNRAKISRNLRQKEDIKIILEF